MGLFVDILGLAGTVIFFMLSGSFLIIYSIVNLRKEHEKYGDSVIKYLSKYYSIRVLAGLSLMGSFAVGFLAGAKYGLLIGLTSFFATACIGIYLHLIADKFK